MVNLVDAFKKDLANWLPKERPKMHRIVKCRLIANFGESDILHVRGAVTCRDYGPRLRDEVFLVHRDDVLAQPHLFEILEESPSKWMAQSLFEAQLATTDLGTGMKEATKATIELSYKLPRTCDWCDTENITLLSPISPGGYYTCPVCGGWA